MEEGPTGDVWEQKLFFGDSAVKLKYSSSWRGLTERSCVFVWPKHVYIHELTYSFRISTMENALFSLPNVPQLPKLPRTSLGISLPLMYSSFLIQKQILKMAKHLAGYYF